VNVAANQVVSDLLRTVPRPATAQRETFERALIRDYPGLTLLLLRHTRDRQLAADILQDAIVTTLAKLDDGSATPSPAIAGFVFRTAMNHLRNHRRREQLRGGGSAAQLGANHEEPRDELASPEIDTQREANARVVRRLLQGLGSARDREVLMRFYMQEQSREDICAALGLSEVDFSRVIYRARERMRRQLEGAGMGRLDLFCLLTITSLLAVVR